MKSVSGYEVTKLFHYLPLFLSREKNVFLWGGGGSFNEFVKLARDLFVLLI